MKNPKKLKKSNSLKKLLIIAIALIPMAGNAAFVDKSSQPAIMTVSEVKNMKDDQPVIMRGSIEKHIKKDKYQFVDETGKIVIEIDGDDWRGLDVTPEDTITIYGETEKSWYKDMEVDVDRVEIVKPNAIVK